MRLVLDASAGIRLTLQEASRPMREAVAEADLVLVPELYDFEVTNAVWKYGRLGHWSTEECRAVLATAQSLPDERVSGEGLSPEVLVEATLARHPAYDLYYAVLARRLAASLVTADGRLKKLCKRLGVGVVG